MRTSMLAFWALALPACTLEIGPLICETNANCPPGQVCGADKHCIDTATVKPCRTTLTATAVSATQVDLSWGDCESETEWRVERRDPGGEFALLPALGHDTARFSDRGLTGTTRYAYRVRGHLPTGDDEWSNEAEVTTRCTPDETRDCFSPGLGDATRHVGVCRDGKETCDSTGAWPGPGHCEGEKTSQEGGSTRAETCNGLDDDCDGFTDAGDSKLVRDACEKTVGVCAGGLHAAAECTAGHWNACASSDYGQGFELLESSCDGKDNDCDGETDAADADLVLAGCEKTAGVCAGKLHSPSECHANGWLACTEGDFGADYEPAETRCDGQDNDCDAATDEGAGAQLSRGCPGEKGICAGGNETCVAIADSGVETWSACSISAGAETCNGLDDDCDGHTDADDANLVLNACEEQTGVCAGSVHSSVECVGGNWQACVAADFGSDYEGVESKCDGKDNDCDGMTDGADTNLVHAICEKTAGVCAGTVHAASQCGVAGWSACTGEEYGTDFESLELRCDGKDNDCDGATDGGDPDIVLAACGKTSGVCAGALHSASRCLATGWTDCVAADYGSDFQQTESRCDGLDNDCDGSTDDAGSGTLVQACPDAKGACTAGDETCVALADSGVELWSECSVVAGDEACNGLDDDCDGVTDNHLVPHSCAKQLGVCAGSHNAVAECSAGHWLDCSDADYGTDFETVESRCDGKDNDCDGSTDPGCGVDGGYPDAGQSDGGARDGGGMEGGGVDAGEPDGGVPDGGSAAFCGGIGESCCHGTVCGPGLACSGGACTSTAAGGRWAATGALGSVRSNPTTTLLPNGMVLVAGGGGSAGALASAELYDPEGGTWSATGSMTTARSVHAGVLLRDGTVLVAGGEPDIATSELFDPSTGRWTATGSLITGRHFHEMVLLPDGRVIAVAGRAAASQLTSTEVYSPATKTWSAGPSLSLAPGGGFMMTRLRGGSVMLAGGWPSGPIANVFLLDPLAMSWTAAASLDTGRTGSAGVLLTDGRLLLTGGYSGMISSLLFHQGSGQWSSTGGLANGRYGHAAALLPDGRALVCGGRNSPAGSSDATFTCEVYSPSTGNWTATDSVPMARMGRAWTLLPSGRVLAAGGSNDGSQVRDSAVYKPDLSGGYGVRPLLSEAPGSAVPGQVISVLGRGFSDVTEGVFSNEFQRSPSNFPLVRLTCGSMAYWCPTFDWTDTSTKCTVPPNVPPGDCALTVVVNGIPSATSPLLPVVRASTIVFSSGRAGATNLFRMQADGAGVTQLTQATGSQTAMAPAFSPDGSKIAYSWNDGSTKTIHVMNADGSSDHAVPNTAGVEDWYGNHTIAWSGDGTRLVYDEDRAVRTIGIDGSNKGTIWTCNGGWCVLGGVAWHPTSGKIYAGWSQIGNGCNGDIYTMDADGSAPTLFAGAAMVGGLQGDGAWLYYNTGTSGLCVSYKIVKVRPDGTGTTVIDASNCARPRASHDGSTVIATCASPSNVFRFNPDGTGKTQLTFSPTGEGDALDIW